LPGRDAPADIAAFSLPPGADAGVITRGAHGAYYRTQLDAGFVEGVPVAQVVDTVGAGDGFAVGLISALLESRGILEAVQRANWIGSRAVQSRGDMEGLPLRHELPEHTPSLKTASAL
ncbi:PfkB family carbohydrate kinase, partial [Pseudomonas protegens]|uniref:carbohydrate kinase family protein n=1 Tax=Pseudomonas protegens TaxID=380021 RepID=UPI0034D60002